MTPRPSWFRPLAVLATALVLTATAGVTGAGATIQTGPEPSRPDVTQAAETTPAAATHGSGSTAPTGEATTVTLVTGDVVTVRADPGNALTAEVTRPAPRPDGRTVLFSTVRERQALYVYPSDTAGLIRAGRLDRQLFDVAYLVGNGYSDRASTTLPLIVQYPPSATARTGDRAGELARLADTLPASADVTPLASVDGAALRIGKADAPVFWASVRGATATGPTTLGAGLSRVWLDSRVRTSLDVSVPMIGAPQTWRAGYDGAGVKVAVLDTGIDAGHPDLAGKIVAARGFVGGDGARDGHGHGTHVASTIAGSGAASGGRFTGVAPGATLLVGKVLDDTGSGTASQIIAGMQWAASQGADVVNMSLGGCCGDGSDPMSQAVNALTAQSGTLFVIAAGNDGASGDLTIAAPGAADAALTVAAVDKQDRLAPFSGRGPRPVNLGLKPDIAAPGVAITAARADGTGLGPIVDDAHTTLSGTSMATPHVAGAAALLAQRHGDWSPARLKDALMSTAKDDGYGAYEQGAGRVDVARAASQGVHATGGVDFGRLPYEQTTPASRTITYTNDTDAPVTLALTTTITAHQGTPPPGALRLDRASVTVPAHGSAPVQVTFDPTGGPQTWYEGAVRASTAASGITVTTAVGAYRELKKVTLTARVIPPNGASELRWGGWLLVRLDGRPEVPAIGEGPELPEISGQLDAGRYAVRTFAQWRDAAGAPNSALVVASDVDATHDNAVVFDLRRAKRLTTRVARPTEAHVQQFGFVTATAGGRTVARSEVRMYGGNTMWTLPTGPKPRQGEFYAYSQRVYTQTRLSTRIRRGPTMSRLDLRYPVPNVLITDDEIARFDGRRTLPVVDVGRGTPDELRGLNLRGRLALLDLADICATTCTGYAADRVAAVAAAGAAGVVGFGSVGQGFLDPDPYAARAVWPAYPIPTTSLPADQGRALRAAIARGPVTVDVTGTANPRYLYALTYPWLDRVPARVDDTVTDAGLYRVNNRIHADGPGVANLSWNAQLPLADDHRVGDPIPRIGNGNGLPVRAPATIATYYGPPRRDVGWNHGAILTYDAPDDVSGYHRNGWADGRTEEFILPGRRTDDLGEHPLVPNTTTPPVGAARYSVPTCLSCRNGDMLNPVNVLSADGIGGGYQAYDITGGTYGDPQTELRLYRDGVELPVRTGIAWIAPPFFGYQNPYFTLPAERANYRLTERYTTPWRMQRYARTVETSWNFASQRPASGYTSPEQGATCMGWYITLSRPGEVCQATGQLFLGYDLGLGLDNSLPAGAARRVTLRAYHSPLLAAPPQITGLEVWTSVDDGAHWSKVRTTGLGDGRFAATVVHPPLANTSGAVSLRVRATDAAGNTVEQTIHRAYGLTP